MKQYFPTHYLTILALLLLAGCSSQKPEPEKTAPAPPAHSEIVDAQPWGNFWHLFLDAVKKHDMDKVAEMTDFPLFVNLEQQEDFWDKAKFVEQYPVIFDDKTIDDFTKINDMDVKQLPSNDRTADYLHTPHGADLRYIDVYFKTQHGADGEVESSKTFFFGQANGKFKLMVVVVAT